MEVMAPSAATAVNFVQSLKVLEGMVSTEAGRRTSFREVQPEKVEP